METIKDISEFNFIKKRAFTGFNFPKDYYAMKVDFIINEADKLLTNKGLRFDIDVWKDGAWKDVAYAQVEGYGPDGFVSEKHGVNPNQFIRFRVDGIGGLPARIRVDGNGFRSGVKISKMTLKDIRAEGSLI